MALNKNAKKWVRALRSGKFKQVKRHLAVVDRGFCCLGVACELAIKDGVKVKKELDREANIFVYAGNAGYLPNRVRKWLGLNSRDGSFKRKNRLNSLVYQNDSGKTFSEIADIIESEPERLFAK